MAINSTIKAKRSSVPGKVPLPESLEVGQIALNLADKKIYSKDGDDNIITLNEGTPAAGATGELQFNTDGEFDSSADLSFNPDTKTLQLGTLSVSETQIRANDSQSDTAFDITTGLSTGSMQGIDLRMRSGDGVSGRGGNLSLDAGVSVQGTGGSVIINAGFGVAGDGGSVSLTAGGSGAASGGMAGNVSLIGGFGQNSNNGGSVVLLGGNSAEGTAGNATVGGNTVYLTTEGVTRFQVKAGGEIGLGDTGLVGEAGQVLTSGGEGVPPSWQDSGAGASGPDRSIQVNDNGVLAGSSAFEWDIVDEELTVGKLTLAKNGTGTIIKATAGTGSTMTILGDGSTTGDGGQLYLAAGASSTGEGGTVLISGGTAVSGTKGGTVALFSGTTQNGSPVGDVQFGLGDDTALTLHGETGSWRLGNSGASGTAGQALVSNGPDAAPSWQDVGGGGAGPAGTTGQLQINSAGEFGAIASGTVGQVLLSGGAGQPPVFGAIGAANQIPYNSSGSMVGSSRFTYNPSLGFLTVGNTTGAYGFLAFEGEGTVTASRAITLRSTGTTATNGWVSIRGGSASTGNFSGGVTIQTQSTAGEWSLGAGDLTLTAGDGAFTHASGGQSGGNVRITAGAGLGANGSVTVTTGATQQLKIDGAGTWLLGASEESGTAGQVLVSGGAGQPPVWAAAPGGGGSPGGATTQLQLNIDGEFAGNADLTYASDTLSVGALRFNGATGFIESVSGDVEKITIKGNTRTGGGGQAIFLEAGASSSSAPGGGLFFSAGNNTVGTGGSVSITAGSSTADGGGLIALAAGDSAVAGGDVAINAGNSTAGTTGGTIVLAAGNTEGGEAGAVRFVGGHSVGGTSGEISFMVNNQLALVLSPDGSWNVGGVGGGGSGQVLTSGGAGTSPYWADAPSGGTPGGSNTQIQYNDAGAFAGNANFTYSPSLGYLTVGSTSGTTGYLEFRGQGTVSSAGALNLRSNGTTALTGSVTIRGGSATNGNTSGEVRLQTQSTTGPGPVGAGDLVLTSGSGGFTHNGGNQNGGNVRITAGTGLGVSGSVVLTTGETQRLKIGGTGAWGLGASEVVGTAGQVLTSNGEGAEPTWTTIAAGGSPGGSDTQIQYNNAGAFAGSADYTWNNTTKALKTGTITLTAVTDPSWVADATRSVNITGGAGSTNPGGTVTISGGAGGTFGAGGAVLAGGNAASAATAGGSVTIRSGSGPSLALSGNINFTTGQNGVQFTRFRITPTGAWGLGTALAYGTAGQMLISAGTDSAPSWTSRTPEPTVMTTTYQGGTDFTLIYTVGSGSAARNHNVTMQGSGSSAVTINGMSVAGQFNEMLIGATNWGLATMSFTNTINWKQPDGTTTTSLAGYLTSIGRTALLSDGTDFIYLWSQGTTLYGKIL